VEDVALIRAARDGGATYQQLAERFKLSLTTIYKVCTGQVTGTRGTRTRARRPRVEQPCEAVRSRCTFRFIPDACLLPGVIALEQGPVADGARRRGPKRWPPGPCSVCGEHTEKRVTGKCKNCYARDLARKPEQMVKVRQRKYGLSDESYQRLIHSQQGACAVCGRTFANAGRKPCIDHDHSTGLVRGMLCHGCNTAIGKLGDTAESLIRAAEYLVSFEEGSRLPTT
jgi:hypothetical protein